MRIRYVESDASPALLQEVNTARDFEDTDASQPQAIWSVLLEPRFAPVRIAGVRPFASAQLGRSWRRFDLEFVYTGRQVDFSSAGWTYGASAGLQLPLVRNVLLEAAFGAERTDFNPIHTVEREWRNTRAEWTRTGWTVGLGWQF